MSRIIDWKDRSTAVIFGDGAGAVVLGADSNSEYESVLHVEGGDSVIKIPQHIGNSPFFENEAEPPYTQMAGQETFRFAVTSIVNDIHELLEKTATRSTKSNGSFRTRPTSASSTLRPNV